MALTNTSRHYGSVTKTFHWATALLILTLIPLGMYANSLPFSTDAELAQKAWLFSVHKTLGVAAFVVALARILWAVTQTKPALLHPDRRIESFTADLVHWLLYAALVIVPLSGWITHAAAEGYAPILWPLGQGLPLVPKSPAIEYAAAAIHGISTKVLIASLLLHVAGAFKHHLIDRDATLRRMLPGQPTLGPVPSLPGQNKTPVMAATAIWALAIGLGAAVGLASDTNGPPPAALAPVASDWTVDTGTIDITVTQFGNPVSGSFADWTAAISFDETRAIGELGHVTATISIPSLTLGSVTDQAMGPDFFDATAHPTAVFDAVLRHASDRYEAAGNLTIRGNSVPLALPFALSINGNQAEMRSDFTLDRRDFGIGDNLGDESSLAFGVKIALRLTATRAGVE